jgi:hypothetical protein
VDIDLKPYLSPENVDLCSRNSCEIFFRKNECNQEHWNFECAS